LKFRNYLWGGVNSPNNSSGFLDPNGAGKKFELLGFIVLIVYIGVGFAFLEVSLGNQKTLKIQCKPRSGDVVRQTGRGFLVLLTQRFSNKPSRDPRNQIKIKFGFVGFNYKTHGIE